MCRKETGSSCYLHVRFLIISMKTLLHMEAFPMSDLIEKSMRKCTICPRNCGVDRLSGQIGYCGQTATLTGARAALHYWEEPCISGTNGSGAVFFSGCNMKCVFCQNHSIALGSTGMTLTLEHLAEIFLSLQDQGAHNINLVTPTHFVPQIITALSMINEKRNIPIVYNTSGYEKVETLAMLEGYVDIFLPDLKYYSAELSKRYSNAADYFVYAEKAIAEMLRQTGRPVFDEKGLMKKGVIVRHMLLPGQSKDTKKVLRFLHETFGDDIWISIMNQYTPMPGVTMDELHRRITEEEYDKILNFADMIGIRNGFMQEGETASDSFIPPFDYEGLRTP